MADEKRPWREALLKEMNQLSEGSKLSGEEAKKFRGEIIKGYLTDSISCLNNIIEKDIDKIERIVDALIKVHDTGGQIFIMGNGGSASIASHIASDFSKAWLGDRLMRLKAFSLTDNVSLLTAWMNDAGRDQMFVGPLETLMNKGDVVIGISGSGTSKNVVEAIKFARAKGALTIGFTGFKGGHLKNEAEISFVVPSNSFKRLEDVHMLLGHLIKAVLVKEIKQRYKEKKQ
jgi:D-sedoheptulose 7-phosphate isomerase